jgi:hypothetical protein
MLDRRFQILLDPDRDQRVREEARRRRVSVATVIRDAIDVAYPVPRARRSAATRRILSAPTMPVSDPEALRRELDEVRGRRR